MTLAVIGFIAALPFLTLALAALRAALLFWPTMLAFGAVHSHIEWVPALGWQATFWVVFLLSLLIPTGSNTSSSD